MRSFSDPFRPSFHFTPEAHWMNDPNGLVFSGGLYHLFYQYFPGDIVWGPMHWGHATSVDLVSWRHQPVAFFPDDNGWIFSGSAVVDSTGSAGFGSGSLVAIFTLHDGEARKRGAVGVENQGLGFSRDGGSTWEKYAGNPVLRNSGESDFRDPKVFPSPTGSGWNLVLAAGDRIKIYSSDNLRDWRHESDFFPDAEGFGVWECPDLFPIKAGAGLAWVMLLSQTASAPNGGSGTRYLVGDFDGRSFTARSPLQWIDWGKDYYAAVTYSNTGDEKRIIVGWMSNWQYAAKTPTCSWRGAMALPRELSLERSGETAGGTEGGSWRLKQAPVQGFAALARSVVAHLSGPMPMTAPFPPSGRADITLAVTEASGAFSVELSNAVGERFTVECEGGAVRVDRRSSGLVDFSADFAPACQTMEADRPIRSVRLILDACSVEIFFNEGRATMTNLVFPSRPFSSVTASGSGLADLTVTIPKIPE